MFLILFLFLAECFPLFGQPEMYWSIMNNDPIRTLEVLESDRSPDILNEIKNPPSLLALKKGNYDVLQVLLMKGASPDQQDEQGRTLLLLACREDRIDLVQLLLKFKAKTQLLDKSGNSWIHLACNTGDFNLISLVLKENKGKIDINTPNYLGITPLMLVYRSKSPKSINLIISLGANIKKTDFLGRTITDFAFESQLNTKNAVP